MKLQEAIKQLKDRGWEDCDIWDMRIVRGDWSDEFPISFEAVKKLDDKDLYICMYDYQTNDFSVGCYGTLRDWGEKVLDWAHADDYGDSTDDAEFDNRIYVYQLMNYFKPETLIDLINDIWQIEIIKLED